MNLARTYRCTRMRRWVERSNDTEPLPLRPFCRGYIIATRGYDFREGHDDEQKSVLGEARAVGNDEIDRRREWLHLLGDAGLGAVGNGIYLSLAGTDEGDDSLRPDRHVARVGDDRIKPDMEAVRRLD